MGNEGLLPVESSWQKAFLRELEIVHNIKNDRWSIRIRKKESGILLGYLFLSATIMISTLYLFANVYEESNQLDPFIYKSPDISIFPTVKIQ